MLTLTNIYLHKVKLEIKSLKLKFSNLKYNKNPQQTVGQPRSKVTKHSFTSKVFSMCVFVICEKDTTSSLLEIMALVDK